jgi:uncharacterized protein
MRRWLPCIFVAALVVLSSVTVWASEVIPPSPEPHYIVDQANVLKPETVAEMDAKLGAFERETTNQIVVGIYPTMQSQDSIAAYSVRVFEAWKPGTKGKDNGVLLLIFINDRKAWITTGYGLEGALPDATAFAIVDNDIKPHFKVKDYDGGVRAAVASIIAATKGQYKAVAKSPAAPIPLWIWLIVIVLVILYVVFSPKTSGNIYSTRRRGFFGGGGLGGGWSSGSSSGGGFSGGGFSGGGGRTGGGGAGGSW